MQINQINAKNKSVAVILLSLSAALLLLANFYTAPAKADFSIKDRDYQMVTAHTNAGGESLYVMDNHSGLMAIFTYDPNVRAMRARAIISVPDMLSPH
jgi:hypothetical protein